MFAAMPLDCTNHCPERPLSCQVDWIQVLPFHTICVAAPFCTTWAVWPHAWKVLGVSHCPVACWPCSLVTSSCVPFWTMSAVSPLDCTNHCPDRPPFCHVDWLQTLPFHTISVILPNWTIWAV